MASELSRRIEELFLAAADLLPADRERYLGEHCGGDRALRDEVDSLLRHDSPAEFLQSPVIRHEVTLGPDEPAADSDVAPPLPTSEPQHPRHIGGYEIIRIIGEGGMGTVYLARQDNPRREVALKVIRPGISSRNLLKRFQHEAHILGKMHHPGIASIYEAGMAEIHTADGGVVQQPFFAMEYFEGCPVTEYARLNNQTTSEKLALMATICDAAQHAHEHGVVHRDLKPDNIIVDAEGRAKILDFGIARATDAETRTLTGQTGVGQLIGTIPYMSPEQVAGDSSDIDARSDVYALGVVLFDLLSGKLPYEIRNRSIPEAIRIIREQEPSRLSSVDTSFRGEIETIVARALEKDRQRRYQSAAELADDLRRYLRSEPIRARPISRMYQLRKFVKRNKGLVGGVLATMLALTVGLVVAVVLALDAQSERNKADWVAYTASIASGGAALREHDVPGARRYLSAAPIQLRGWEWRHLHSQLDNSSLVVRISKHLRTWDELATIPRGIAFSSDGALVRSLQMTPDSSDGSTALLRSWRVADGTLQATRQFDAPRRARLLTGQDTVIVTDLSGSIIIEGVRRGTRLSEYPNGAMDQQRHFALRASSRTLRRCVLSRGRTLALFDVDRENLRILLEEAADRLGDMALSEDGALLACEVGREIWIWDCDSGRPLCQTEKVGEGVTDLAFSPDNRRLVASSLDGLLRIWDAATGKAADWEVSSQHTDGINAVVFSPDGTLLASAGQDRTIRLQSSKSGSPIGVLVGHEGEIERLVFSPDGSRLASASADGTIRIWEVDAAKDPRVLRGHTFIVYPVAISPDGTRIASGDWNGVIRLWDAAGSEQITAIEPRAAYRTLVYDAEFSPDGAFLAVSEETWDTPRGVDAEYWIRVLDTATGETLAQLGLGPWRWISLAFDPHGARLGATSRGGGIAIWDMDSFEEVTSVKFESRGGNPIVYSPDGRVIATASADFSVLLLDSVTLEPIRRLDGHQATVIDLAFDPDGSRIASASYDGTVGVWDVADGALLAMLRGHSDRVHCVAFSPDGARIASGSNDKTIRLWDAVTYNEVAQLRGHSDHVWSIAWSPDSQWMVSGSGDYQVRIWDTEPMNTRLAAARVRKQIVARIEQKVKAIFAQSADPLEAAVHLRADPSMNDREREVALQMLLGLAVEARNLRAHHAEGDEP